MPSVAERTSHARNTSRHLGVVAARCTAGCWPAASRRFSPRCPVRRPPAQIAELWVEPEREPRSLLGRRRQARWRPIRRRPTRSSRSSAAASAAATPSTDPTSREWSAKFPPEAPTEVVASRLLWGIGYHQPPIYYLAEWQAEKATSPNPQLPARFREKDARLPRPRDATAPGRTTRTRSSARAQLNGLLVAAGDARQLGSQGRAERASTRSRSRSKARGAGTSRATSARRSAAPACSTRRAATRGLRADAVHHRRRQRPRARSTIAAGTTCCSTTSRRPTCAGSASGCQRSRDAQWHDAFRAGGYPPADRRPFHPPARSRRSPKALALKD